MLPGPATPLASCRGGVTGPADDVTVIDAAARAGRRPLVSLADVLLPPRCALCDRHGRGICMACAARLPPPQGGAPPGGLDALVSLCAYDGAGRDLVLALKRANRRDAARPLGEALAEAARPVVGPGPAVVTWAPTTPARRRARGFDQAEVLARSVARAAVLPAARLLWRNGGPQAGLDRLARLSGPAFAASGLPTSAVVLVDDVVTSGATMAAAAAALRSAGARQVVGVTVARAREAGTRRRR
jgi:predicted amidophosphoribosyltransferase